MEDALYFLPRAYEDRRQIKTISQLTVGKMETVIGTVLTADMTFHRLRRTFEMLVADETGTLLAKWFNFNPRYMKGRFSQGHAADPLRRSPPLPIPERNPPPRAGGPRRRGSGRSRRSEPASVTGAGRFSAFQAYRAHLLGDRRALPAPAADPPHPEERGGPLCRKGLQRHPEEVCQRQKLIPLPEALRRVHFPDPEDNIALLNEGKSPAHRRLIFDEFFFLEMGLALRRSGTLLEKGIAFPIHHRYTNQLRDLLPFALTPAQERVLSEIESDMRRPHPMNRLLQGDVGSGKTIVALMAGLMAIEGGYQVAIMAPTEILAEQHFLGIRPLVETLGLTAPPSDEQPEEIRQRGTGREVQTGAARILIGTHALIQEGVEFQKLGLAIIDEQHKFGVIQRVTLKKKGYNPDVLVMTATPIPRTLAMTIYGDLDVSVIDQLPPGRGTITTRVFNDKERFRVYRTLREEISRGKQAYVVYPLVEESERLDLKDATQMAQHLQKDIFPEFKVGLIHGRMKSEEKETIMADFKAGRIHILVSTIVIEVGIDVPNASVMVIEHAEAFGLSQLHQLRGRVGRGKDPSQCLLIAQYPQDRRGRAPPADMEQTTDGFKISEEDLAIRGPGELLGTQQSGPPDFRVANFLRDIQLLGVKPAKKPSPIISRDPILSRPEHLFMKETLKERWKGRLELATIG